MACSNAEHFCNLLETPQAFTRTDPKSCETNTALSGFSLAIVALNFQSLIAFS